MTGAATKTETYTYIYEGQSIAMEILSKVENGGAPVKEVTRYVHSQRIDEPLAMERNGQYYYFHANRLGSIAAITNAAKTVVQSYTYDSFGMPEPSTSFRNSYTYTGREWDGETGLYYYRARYYDPMAGRFISKDPIGLKGGFNLYVALVNNPLNYTDSYGLTVAKCCGMTSDLPNDIVMTGLECMSKCLKTTILISSGWRNDGQNTAAGGTDNSYHLKGLAADVHEPPSQDKLRRAAEECGLTVLPKKYPNRIHVDIRGGNTTKKEPDDCVCQKIREGKSCP